MKLSVKVVKELDEVLAELRWILLEKKRVQNIFTLAEFFGLSDSGPRLQFFAWRKIVVNAVEPHNQATLGLQKKSVLRSPELPKGRGRTKDAN